MLLLFGKHVLIESGKSAIVGKFLSSTLLDSFSTGRTKIGYGRCLADLGMFAIAESNITEGYTTLQDKGSDLTVAFEALIHLYSAWNNPAEQQKYRDLLAGLNAAAA